MRIKWVVFVLSLGLLVSPVFAQTATKSNSPMKKYFLHGSLVAKEGMTDQLTAILLDASALVSTAKGCVLYVIGRDPNDPRSVWVTEIWDAKEDHDNSLTVAGVRELIAKAIPLLDGQPKPGQALEIVGGKGSN